MNGQEEQLKEYENACLWYIDDGVTVTIGITQKAIDLVGGVTDVDLAEVGDELTDKASAGEIFGKNTSMEVLTPCSMRITEWNEEVMASVNFIEDDPTGDAWLLRGEKIADER